MAYFERTRSGVAPGQQPVDEASAKPAVASTCHTTGDSSSTVIGWPRRVSSGTTASATPPPTT